MLEDLAEFLKLREEKIKLGKIKLVVRELDGTADHSILKEEQDRSWRILVRCAFREDGVTPAFTDDDIPTLKRKSATVTMPLIAAVTRVNGFGEEEVKNSDAAQD